MNEIDKAKKKAIDALKAKISEMSSAAYSILLEAIENTFDIKSGKIVVDKNFIKQLNRLTVDVLDLIQKEPKFTGPVSKFIKRTTEIAEVTKDFQKEINGIKTPSFSDATKIITDEIIDKLLDNGLNQHFVQPIRDLLYQNATSGLSQTQAKAQIKQFIQGGGDVSGKLQKYIEPTAQQAVSSYSGMINKKIMEEFEMDAWLVTGSLIDNSSPQCRYAIEELGGLITKENWPKVKAIGEKFNGWIKGTTFENLSVNLLHHGCRHGFYAKLTIKKAA